MEHKPSSNNTSLKNLRTARSLSQNEVAEAIGTSANTVSRWERGIANPSPYYRRKLAELFRVDPQAFFSDLNGETDKTTGVLPSEPATGGDSSNQTEDIFQTEKTTAELPPRPATGGDLPNEIEDASQGDRKRPPPRHRGPSLLPTIPRRVYIPVASIIIFTLVLGCVLVLPSLLHKPSPLFPALCSGNFQSTNTSIIPTPATETSPDGEPIGLSEGATIFDLNRPNQQEVQDKLQAAQDWVNNPQDVASSLTNAISSDQTDAEAQIYLENWQVLSSNHPHVTFVVGVSFESNSDGASDGVLQGAFNAQKECNTHNKQDDSKTQIVLMIANIGGNNPDDRASSATLVTNQIADQASKDPTIIGIMGWPLSQDSINVNHQLKIRESHLPMVSPSASSDELQDMSNFFRVCPTDAKQAQIAANILLKTKPKKRVAILYDQTTSYSKNLKDDFAKDIPATNIVGSEAYIGGNTKTLQEALNKLLSHDPDVIFFSAYASDLFSLLNNIPSNKQTNNLLIVGGDALSATNSYNPLPDLHTVFFTAFGSLNQWDGTGQTPPFFQDYKTNFGTIMTHAGLSNIDAHALLGYDATLALLNGTQQVLSTKNTLIPSDLTQALKQITVTNPLQGVTGRIAFESNGDQAPGKMIFVEHIEGKHLVIDEKHGCLFGDNCGT